jgi:hypothetical protein
LGSIVTNCPITDKEIPTGIETDLDTFSRIASIVGRVWCPHCKAEHQWSVAEARIRDVQGGSRSEA